MEEVIAKSFETTVPFLFIRAFAPVTIIAKVMKPVITRAAKKAGICFFIGHLIVLDSCSIQTKDDTKMK
jgi:hypothetical protein